MAPEVDPTPIASERPRRQKRRSLKLTIPSLRPGRRRSLSLPPIIASVVALRPKRTATSPSAHRFGNISSSPTSPKRFWHALRSSLKDSGLNVGPSLMRQMSVSKHKSPRTIYRFQCQMRLGSLRTPVQYWTMETMKARMARIAIALSAITIQWYVRQLSTETLVLFLL